MKKNSKLLLDPDQNNKENPMHSGYSQDDNDDFSFELSQFVSELNNPRPSTKKRKRTDDDIFSFDDEVVNDLKTELKKINKEYGDYKSGAETKLTDLQRNLTISQAKINELNVNIQNLSLTISADKTNIAELKQKLESIASELKDKDSIKESLTQQQNKLDRMLDEEKQKFYALEETLHEAQNALKEHKEQLTALAELQPRYHNDLAAERKTVAKLKDEMNAKDTQYHSLLAEQKEELDKKNKQIKQLQIELEKEKASAEDLTQTLTALVEETTTTLKTRIPVALSSSHFSLLANTRSVPRDTAPTSLSLTPGIATPQLMPQMLSSLSPFASSAGLPLILSLLTQPVPSNPSMPGLFAPSQNRSQPLSPAFLQLQSLLSSVERQSTPSFPVSPAPPF